MSTHTRTRVSQQVKAANGETGQAHGPGLTTTIAPARATWWHYSVGFAFGCRPMRGTIQAVDPSEARALLLNRHANADPRQVVIGTSAGGAQ